MSVKPLRAPAAAPLNESSTSLGQGKGPYFLLMGITSLDMYSRFECKNEKIPLWSFPAEPHKTSLSPCPLAIIIPPVKEL